jgi:hypothetical protein
MKTQPHRTTEVWEFLSGIPLFYDLNENTRDLVAQTSLLWKKNLRLYDVGV